MVIKMSIQGYISIILIVLLGIAIGYHIYTVMYELIPLKRHTWEATIIALSNGTHTIVTVWIHNQNPWEHLSITNYWFKEGKLIGVYADIRQIPDTNTYIQITPPQTTPITDADQLWKTVERLGGVYVYKSVTQSNIKAVITIGTITHKIPLNDATEYTIYFTITENGSTIGVVRKYITSEEYELGETVYVAVDKNLKIIDISKDASTLLNEVIKDEG